MANTAEDQKFVEDALAGDMGEDARDAAQGVLTDAATYGFEDGVPRVAEYLRTVLAEMD